MDIWKFYDITHREHAVCNPTSEEKLARLVGLVRLGPQAPVVDIACGKGEFLIRLAEAYGIRGTGIDLSPYCIAEARRRLQARASGVEVVFSQMNGSDYRPDEPRSLCLASCIGASWVFGGHVETLSALSAMIAPGGWVIVGEPYWLQEPAEEYLSASGLTREAFLTHPRNVEAGQSQGLDLLHTLVSSQDDWDRYEGLQWYAAAEYARRHPDDPDLPELLERVAKAKAAYVRWGRDTVGWAIYAFRHRARTASEAHWIEPTPLHGGLHVHRVYLAFGWGMIAFGLLHVAATGRHFHSLTQDALWFASAGLLAVLAGALNLVNRAYGRATPGLRRLTVATNLGLTAFVLLAGAVGHATVAELVVVGVLFAGASVLSSLSAACSRHGAAQ